MYINLNPIHLRFHNLHHPFQKDNPTLFIQHLVLPLAMKQLDTCRRPVLATAGSDHFIRTSYYLWPILYDRLGDFG